MICTVCNKFARDSDSTVLEQERNIRSDIASNIPLVGPLISLSEYRSILDPETRMSQLS